MVKAMSITESFMYVAGKVFGTEKGKSSGPVQEVDDLAGMRALVDQLNGQ